MHTRRAAPLGLILLLLPACGGKVSADDFLRRYAQETCKVDERCYRAWFDSNWDGQQSCIDDQLSASADYADLVADCPFDADKAQECLDNLRKSECATWEDDAAAEALAAPCLEAWTCSSDTGA